MVEERAPGDWRMAKTLAVFVAWSAALGGFGMKSSDLSAGAITVGVFIAVAWTVFALAYIGRMWRWNDGH